MDHANRGPVYSHKRVSGEPEKEMIKKENNFQQASRTADLGCGFRPFICVCTLTSICVCVPASHPCVRRRPRCCDVSRTCADGSASNLAQAGDRIRAYSPDSKKNFMENLEMWMTEPKTTDEVRILHCCS